MKYMCIAYIDEQQMANLPKEELAALAAGCAAWKDSIKKSGHYILAAGLQDSTQGVSLQERRGKLLTTDGPYVETKEQLGGITILEAKDMQEAIAIATRQPIVAMGRVEVRPLVEDV